MRLFIPLLATLVLALVVMTGYNSVDHVSSANANTNNQTGQNAPPDSVRRITATEAKEALDKGEAIIIDVRGEASYEAGHIKGARLIPVNDLLKRLDELPHDKLIITYCSCPAEHTSAAAVINLKAKGFDNAAALVGGDAAWKTAGYPIEKGK